MYNNVVYMGRYIWNKEKAVGNIRKPYVTVSYTLRGNLIRIFSARDADPEEEEAYNASVRNHIGER
jgi:uncharacterized DUF497 family protein